MSKGHIFLFAKVPFGSVVAQLKRKGRNTWAEARSQRAECVGGFRGHRVLQEERAGTWGSREGPDTKETEPGHHSPHRLEELLIDFVLPEVGSH